jgi:uncharacterized protein
MYGVLLALWLFVLPGLYAPWLDYPAPVDAYVNDFAGVLSDAEADEIAQRLDRLYDETGVEVVVVTVPSFSDFGTGDRTLEIFSTNLFNTWAIGDSELNNGALILLAVDDREVRIELGAGYETALDDQVQAVINEQFIPRFREGDYGRGLRDGALRLADVLTAEWQRGIDPARTRAPAPTPSGMQIGGQEPAPAPAPAEQPAAAPAAGPGGGTPIGPLVAIPGGLGVLGLGGYGVYQLLNRRSRRCPNCGGQMHVLDEAADDAFLNAGQQTEELLNSVNYAVWKCDECGNHTLRRERRWFSNYESCPSCGYQALSVQRQRLVEPTYERTGAERIERACRNCNYQNANDITIPRLVRSAARAGGSPIGRSLSGRSSSGRSSSRRSSSSSRSSFGGGRSRGGGRSGKW